MTDFKCNDGEAVPLDEGKAAAGLRCQSGFGFWPNSAHAASPSELLARHPDAGGYCAARCQAELGSKGQSGRSPTLRSEGVTPTAHCRLWVESRASDKEGANGRLLRWPPFAKDSLSGSWSGFSALLAYGGHYRALARGATIPGERPVRPDFEKPSSRGLPQQGGSTHSIAPKALRQFVIDHLERIEFRVKPQSLRPLPLRCVRVKS